MRRIGIIGGGAAGMIAAAFANNAEVTLIEQNEKLGKKIYITGKGRCNVTNNCALYEFFPKIIRGQKFMMSALNSFAPSDLMEFLSDNGVRLKTERGNRVFPFSDKSSDIIKALVRSVEQNGTRVLLNTKVTKIVKNGDTFVVESNNGTYEFDSLIIATGGMSYKATGSTGDGYRFAKNFGHKIVPLLPALVAINLVEDVKPLEGLSLKNVRVSVTANGKSETEFGEMLFTDSGISGPIVLTLSSRINRLDILDKKVIIDFKPALSPETLDERLQSDFGEMPNKDISNILTMLLPRAVIPYVLKQAGIAPLKKGNNITREERFALGYCVKNLVFTIKKLDDINHAVITSGGVELSEVNPKTMESKLVKNLFFAGELLDVDALTGGFNLQCAFSTGRTAGIYASEE